MPTLAESLVAGWISHFWAADHEIKWLDAEAEHVVELATDVLLMGRIDAIGRDAQGDIFFGEWKTSSPRDRKYWKQTWRMNPQSLTYGVLADSLVPGGCKRFTVRKAFKTEPPSYDHAWYSYSLDELAMWRRQLINIAHEQQMYPAEGPWPTNFAACFQYGINYPCPFFEPACSKLQWDATPTNALVRVSHLESERRLNAQDSGLVERRSAETPQLAGGILSMERRGDTHNETGGDNACNTSPACGPNNFIVLDATRVATWFSCRERFRREYIENVAAPAGQALQDGIDAHALWGAYYKTLVKEKQ